MHTVKTRMIVMACVMGVSMLVATFDAPAQLLETFKPFVPERITASASSWQIDLESHNTPQRAIDGAGEAYCYWETREPTEQWLLLDLGDRYRLGGLEIESNGRRINGYKIHVSNDPEDPGVPVATGNLPNTTAYHPIIFDPAYGRYLTIVETNRHDNFLRIRDVRVHVSFSLENPLTGSRTFTSTNEVRLVDFPAPAGYDLYQITPSDSEPTAGWLNFDPQSPPEWVVFDAPPGEGLVTLHAWFADSSETLPAVSVPASITYLRDNADVVAVAREDFEAYSWGSAHPATILVDELDNGSDATIGLHELSLSSEYDLAPEDPMRVVLSDAGNHTVTLTALDLAGNLAHTNVTVALAAGSVFDPHVTAWTGASGTDNWFHHGNWSDGVPGPGASVTVVVGAEIRLTAETAMMGSFTMTGGTLDMQNWQTRLRADSVVFNGGTIRPYQPISPAYLINFDDTEMSNRVWIVCHEYSQGSSATINATGRGYRNPYGPGSTMGTYAPGGGHGGVGAWARNTWSNIGRNHGSVEAPVAPGSGAGRERFSRGGVGGGAVRIDATDNVILNGVIQANGTQGRANQGGGGSGGSILINCQTFSGAASGLLQVNGGDARNSSGGGGGGRIAVNYNSAEQQQVEPVFPPVRFSAKRGLLGNTNNMSEDGTLYLPDLLFLADQIIGTQFMDVHLYAPGLHELAIAGNLTVAGMVGFPEMRKLHVGGNLTLQNNASLRLYGGSVSEAHPFYGTLLCVQGELSIGNGAALYSTLYAFNQPDVDEYDSETQTAARGGVLFDLGKLTIAAGGIVDAVGGGYWASSGPGAGYSTSSTSAAGSGGSYGGLGGGTGSGGPGPIYGVAHMPLLPGSGGNDIHRAGRGGGLLVIQVERNAHIDGLIRADGQTVRTDYFSGGSGGGVLINCGSLTGTGEINARGATTRGGGGRVAVWHPRLSVEHLLKLEASTTLPTQSIFEPSDDPEFNGSAQGGWEEFNGTVSVAAQNGDPGSIFFARYYPGTLFMVH